jgi:hypothetical protein
LPGRNEHVYPRGDPHRLGDLADRYHLVEGLRLA